MEVSKMPAKRRVSGAIVSEKKIPQKNIGFRNRELKKYGYKASLKTE